MKVGFRDMAQMEEWHGTPQHPHELIHHRCIGWRKEPGASPYRWEFAEQGRDLMWPSILSSPRTIWA